METRSKTRFACNEGVNEAELWLKLQHEGDRRARIDFARDARHTIYLRDAAGGQGVWMVDDEFAELVQENDAITLACFGRSDRMQLHHLAYIVFKLTLDPHRHDLLADAHDVQITLRKAIDKYGPTQAWRLMKQAIKQRGHEGPAGVWREYVRQALREGLLEVSNTGPFETSGRSGPTVH